MDGKHIQNGDRNMGKSAIKQQGVGTLTGLLHFVQRGPGGLSQVNLCYDETKIKFI